jgi:hypothetical protein
MNAGGRNPNDGGTLACVQLVAAAVAGIAARLVAPDLDSTAQHQAFENFFLASSALIAALLIALAVQAPFVMRRLSLAVVTAINLVVGEVSSVAALSPALPRWTYDWLFTLTVAGGVGGLIAAIVIGAQTIVARIDASRAAELDALLARLKNDL